MIERLQRNWRQFKAARPGERFRAQYERRHRRGGNPVMRALRLLLGVAVTAAGLVLMPAPGPGMLIVALGLTLLAHESLGVARALDWAELRLRPLVLRGWRTWRGLPVSAQLLLGGFGLLVLVAAGLLSLQLLRRV